jgi:stage V sporulation protein R
LSHERVRAEDGAPQYLRVEQDRIEKIAAEEGLDFFPIVFEILTYDQMNEIAAYGGFPNRYPHWRFGMEYERLAKSYEYGLSKIYEMVINNNPSYAYLLEGNSLVDQKLVMAHVCAHVDFFKNNYCFRATDLDTAGAPSTRCRARAELRPEPPLDRQDGQPRLAHAAHVARQGINKVEEFVDHCLSLENLIDPHAPSAAGAPKPTPRTRSRRRRRSRACASKDYMESFINPEEYLEEQRKKIEKEREKAKKFPEHSERDVLRFFSSTRRSSAGSATSSRSFARRPSTSCRRCRRRS